MSVRGDEHLVVAVRGGLMVAKHARELKVCLGRSREGGSRREQMGEGGRRWEKV